MRQTSSRIADHLAFGDAIVCPDGRVGMLVDMKQFIAVCKFGAAGPVEEHPWRDLRRASRQEVIDADLDGVGFGRVG